MKDKKLKAPLIRIFLFSAAAGAALSYWYGPVHNSLLSYVSENFDIFRTYTLQAALLITGVVYIGVVMFLFTVFILGFFSGNLLTYLARQLRKKQILSSRFKLRRTKSLVTNYEGISEIINDFLKSFDKLKKEHDKFKKIIVTHLDPAMIKEIESRDINEMYLGGRKKDVTVLFSDIRGFTAFTEAHSPDDTVCVLNEYFSTATDIINKNNGNVNKYIGDAILAVFEEPPKYRNFSAADKAVTAAMDIQAKYGLLMNKWKEKIGPGADIGLGIGIAKGRVIAGTIGSEERMEYTVIGDAVNFASRLCSLAGEGQVVISEDTYNEVREVVEAEQCPPVEVKGKTGIHNTFLVKTRKMLR